MTSFYSVEELSNLGLQAFGKNVSISRKCSIYGAARIAIGSNVRIDDFCVLSAGEGGIQIGNNVHIAVFASLIGHGKIELKDFSGISSRVSVYSSNDDYSGEFMSNPMVPAKFTGVLSAEVSIGRHVLVGSGAIILPGVTLAEGCVVGALSLVNKDCEGFWIYVGNPARKIVQRNRNLLKLEQEYLAENQ